MNMSSNERRKMYAMPLEYSDLEIFKENGGQKLNEVRNTAACSVYVYFDISRVSKNKQKMRGFLADKSFPLALIVGYDASAKKAKKCMKKMIYKKNQSMCSGGYGHYIKRHTRAKRKHNQKLNRCLPSLYY